MKSFEILLKISDLLFCLMDLLHIFLDFFIQYDRIYDFSSSLDLFELEAEIIENSREENGKIIISVEKFNELFSETFEIDTDYYQPQEVFREFRNQIIHSGKTAN